VKVYCAAKSRHHPWFAALRACGLPIASSWLDWPPNHDGSEPTADQWAEHSVTCLREAAECDVLLLYVLEGEQHFGALLETAAALANDKRVFLVSPHPWPFLRNHPRVRSFDTLQAAVTAIMAGAVGEKLRAERETVDVKRQHCGGSEFEPKELPDDVKCCQTVTMRGWPLMK
jgi:hypothetical protein